MNTKYVPATGGQQTEIEFPLAMMVVGNMKRRTEEAPIEECQIVSIEKNNFSSVMKKIVLELNFSVLNRLKGNSQDDLPASINIQPLKDFKHQCHIKGNQLLLGQGYDETLAVMFAEQKSPVHLATSEAESLRNVRIHQVASQQAIHKPLGKALQVGASGDQHLLRALTYLEGRRLALDAQKRQTP